MDTVVPRPFAGKAASRVDDDAFVRLYATGFRQVWRVLRRLGVQPVNLDDAVQDVFVTAWRRRGEFEGRSTERTWLVGIAVRVASEYRRRRQQVTSQVPETLVDHRGDPGVRTESAEAARVLSALLDQMQEERREVFVLTELEQYTAPDIASVLGLNVNTVYTRLRAARREFEELLAAHTGRQR